MQGMATTAYIFVLLGAMTMQMTHSVAFTFIIFLPSPAQY